MEWAGGIDKNARDGKDSIRIPWEDIVSWSPEVIIVSPCGFKLGPAIEQARLLMKRPGFRDLPAAKKNRVYAVDANAHYSRPGVRLVEGVDLLAHLIHGHDSGLFPWHGSQDSYAHVPVPDEQSEAEEENNNERKKEVKTPSSSEE